MRNTATKKRLHDEQLTNGSPVISHWMDRWIGSPALTGSSGKQRRHTSPKSKEATMRLMQSNTLKAHATRLRLLNSTRIQLGNLFTSVSLLSLRSLFFKPRTMRVGNFTSCLSSSAAASCNKLIFRFVLFSFAIFFCFASFYKLFLNLG